MSIENKLAIKHVIKTHPFLATQALTMDEAAIKAFADKAGLTSIFINQNLKLIRNWI